MDSWAVARNEKNENVAHEKLWEFLNHGHDLFVWLSVQPVEKCPCRLGVGFSITNWPGPASLQWFIVKAFQEITSWSRGIAVRYPNTDKAAPWMAVPFRGRT